MCILCCRWMRSYRDRVWAEEDEREAEEEAAERAAAGQAPVAEGVPVAGGGDVQAVEGNTMDR